MKTFVTTNKGELIEISPLDYDVAMEHRWYLDKDGYPTTNIPHPDKPGKRTLLLLHRYLMNPPEGMVIDHRDGDPLNNTRENLRVCTIAENSRNSRKQCNNTSGFKGVCWHKQTKKWLAQIRHNRKNIHLGSLQYS